MSKGEYNVGGATTSAAAHLSQRTRGHSIKKDGLINLLDRLVNPRYSQLCNSKTKMFLKR